MMHRYAFLLLCATSATARGTDAGSGPIDCPISKVVRFSAPSGVLASRYVVNAVVACSNGHTERNSFVPIEYAPGELETVCGAHIRCSWTSETVSFDLANDAAE